MINRLKNDSIIYTKKGMYVNTKAVFTDSSILHWINWSDITEIHYNIIVKSHYIDIWCGSRHIVIDFADNKQYNATIDLILEYHIEYTKAKDKY